MKTMAALLAVTFATGCAYTPLFRPGRPGQGYSPTVRAPLMRELRDVQGPSDDALAGLPHQRGAAVRVGKNGMMRARVRVPAGQYAWEPNVIVLPRPGRLELDFANEDRAHHVVLVSSSDGDRQLLDLPSHAVGRLTVSFDRPGRYWFACPVSNHDGRGMLGVVVVNDGR